MIKLRSSYQYKGQLLQPGRVVRLPERMEKLLVRNDKAEYIEENKSSKKTSSSRTKSKASKAKN